LSVLVQVLDDGALCFDLASRAMPDAQHPQKGLWEGWAVSSTVNYNPSKSACVINDLAASKLLSVLTQRK